MCEWPNRLLQGLELLVTVLLARDRQPPPNVAGVPPAEFAAELITLPSGLLAMVCEAIVKLKVRLGAGGLHARVRAAWAVGEGRRGPCACLAPVRVRDSAVSGIGPSGIGPSGTGPSGTGPSGIGPSGIRPKRPLRVLSAGQSTGGSARL
jgi:hypothetical protein